VGAIKGVLEAESSGGTASTVLTPLDTVLAGGAKETEVEARTVKEDDAVDSGLEGLT
jgi:hypothetical protein